MCVELKIKLKSLADEARTIRNEENKLKIERNFSKLNDLHDHRVHVVRPEARATHIAYGLLRGLGYDQIERTTTSSPNWSRVRSMVKKYSPEEDVQANVDKALQWEQGKTYVAAA